MTILKNLTNSNDDERLIAEIRAYQKKLVSNKEELSRVETIKAETLGDSIDKATELYYGQKIILDAEDMKGAGFVPM